jgi:Ca2+-binding RTX toxin-like protein
MRRIVVLLLLAVVGLAAPADAAGPTCSGRPVTVRLGAGQRPTDGNDVILGTPGDDRIRAKAGTDWVCAGGGDDLVYASTGADRVWGQSGDDVLYGGPGNDRLYGGKGGDYTGGSGGVDHCDVGPSDPDNEGDPSCETGSGAPAT